MAKRVGKTRCLRITNIKHFRIFWVFGKFQKCDFSEKSKFQIKFVFFSKIKISFFFSFQFSPQITCSVFAILQNPFSIITLHCFRHLVFLKKINSSEAVTAAPAAVRMRRRRRQRVSSRLFPRKTARSNPNRWFPQVKFGTSSPRKKWHAKCQVGMWAATSQLLSGSREWIWNFSILFLVLLRILSGKTPFSYDQIAFWGLRGDGDCGEFSGGCALRAGDLRFDRDFLGFGGFQFQSPERLK